MIEHFVPLKFTHEEMLFLRKQYSRLIDLQTQEKMDGEASYELFELEDWFGGLEWLVQRVVNATEA